MENYGWADVSTITDVSELDEMQCDNLFGIHPFYIEKGNSFKCFMVDTKEPFGSMKLEWNGFRNKN